MARGGKGSDLDDLVRVRSKVKDSCGSDYCLYHQETARIYGPSAGRPSCLLVRSHALVLASSAAVRVEELHLGAAGGLSAGAEATGLCSPAAASGRLLPHL